MKKNKIVISIFAAVCLISTIVEYNLIKQDNNKYNELAVMIKQDDGSYIRSNMSAFGNDDYEFDHAVCNNGSTVSANSSGGINLKLLGTDKCIVYLKPTVIGKIKFQAQTTKPDFTQVAQETGLYTTEDDYGISYYFRGNVTNNYVEFGDYIWRIVRINGDGSLRIIYDGTTPHANEEESTDRVLNENGILVNVAFNTNFDNNAYVGYMYGDINATEYSKVHANTNNSTIKTYLDSWYETNIKGKGLAGYVSDTLFCNDRKVTSGTGIGTAFTNFGAFTRANTNADPILTCSQKNDAFTVDDTEKGNGALTYPIGLLTADEYRLAGGKLLTVSTNLYINKPGAYWWLTSPTGYVSGARQSVVNGGISYLGDNLINTERAVAPVINLTAEYVNQLKGSGTMEDPYRQSVTEKIKSSAKESTSTMYSAVEPSNEIKSVTDNKFSKSQQTYTVDATHQNYYMTYASAYTFNTPTMASSGYDFPTYTLTNAQVGKYSDVYGSLPGKYVVNYEGHNSSIAAKSNTINIIYKIVSATATSITYIPSSYSMEFTNSTTGVYTTEDDYGTSYYFRGNIIDNYVKFGKWTENVYRGYNSDQSIYREYFTKEECQADGTYKYGCNKSLVAGKDMYWRIVRINGDGSLRLLYDGTEPHANGIANLDRTALPYQQFNNAKDNNAYIGYMYGSINGTTYNEVHANTNDSAIKTVLETWYEKNFVGTEYESKIGDMLFCNDRSLVNGAGVGTTTTNYGAHDRLMINKIPRLVCPQKNDTFTRYDIKKGNGKLKYPIGLLTADEIAIVGGVYSSQSGKNRGYFINKGYAIWHGSPCIYNTYAVELAISLHGALNYDQVDKTLAVVPVINLSAETANKLVGSGTMDDPYTI